MWPKSVVLCEDRRDVREVLCVGLRSMGIHVVDFPSADAALASLNLDFVNFDAVVTDYDMPGTDGKQFAEQVRVINPTIPIVVISGTINFNLENQALNFQYLKKPFTISSLFQLLSIERPKALVSIPSGDQALDCNLTSRIY